MDTLSPIIPGSIGIHVLSAKIGESIIVTLPDEKWFVVDAFEGTPPGVCRRDLHAVATFIDKFKLPISKCRFVLLTHLHDDHYAGVPSLLRWLRSKREDIPFASHASYRIDNSRLFIRKLLEFQEKSSHKSIGLGPKAAGIIANCKEDFFEIAQWTPLVTSSPGKPDEHYTVSAIGPSQRIAENYTNYRIFKAEMASGTDFKGTSEESRAAIAKLKKSQRKILNNMSIIIHIEFGKNKIILCGDAENNAWEALGNDPVARNTLDHLGDVLQGTTFLKIPHHGSKYACNDVLNRLYQQAKYGVVTHHHRRFSLPSREGLRNILKGGMKLVAPDEHLLPAHARKKWIFREENHTVIPLYLGRGSSGALSKILHYDPHGQLGDDEIQWASISFDISGKPLGWFGGSRLVFMAI